MAKNKVYAVMKDGEELEKLKTLAAAKKLADTEGAEVYCDGECVYQGEKREGEQEQIATDEHYKASVDEHGSSAVDDQTATKDAEATAEVTPIITADPVISRKPTQPDTEPVETTRYRLKSLMNVRKRPSLESTVVGTKPEGTAVRVLKIENDWMHLAEGTFILYGEGEYAEKM